MTQSVCLALPLLYGREPLARQFMREIETSRRSAYHASEARLGITKELWFLSADANPTLIAYIEAHDFATAVSAFCQSADEFDQWFKRELAACTGVDLNNAPNLVLPELLSTYVPEIGAGSILKE